MDTTSLIFAGLLAILFTLALAIALFCFWLIQSSKAEQRRRRIKLVLSRDRAKRLNRALSHDIDEPTYAEPHKARYRGQRSTNENSPEFHRILRDLRFTHFWRSEAWRWDEAHRQLREAQKKGM
jgi:uncharacterized protein HemX